MDSRQAANIFLEKVAPIISAYRNGETVSRERVMEAVAIAVPYFEVDDPISDKMTILATQLEEHARGALGLKEDEVGHLVELYEGLESELSRPQ